MIGVVIAVLAGVLLFLLLAPPSSARRRTVESRLGEETVASEQEMRDLDALTTPEDADGELPDWGPGAPKQRR